MEIHRHSRHRSRAHSFTNEERVMANKSKKGKNHKSKKPRVYRDIDRDWQKNKGFED